MVIRTSTTIPDHNTKLAVLLQHGSYPRKTYALHAGGHSILLFVIPLY